MSEVSCRVFDLHFRDFKARGIDPQVLVEGTNVSVQFLKAKHERVPWTTYLRIMENVRRVSTDDELIALGGAFFRNPLIRPAALIGKLLFDLTTFYRWFSTDPESGGTRLFACIRAGYENLGGGRVEVTILNDEGFPPCREFFIITLGVYRDIPRIFGAPPALVEMEMLPRGAKYRVTLPKVGGFLVAIRKIISWPFTIAGIASELRDANKVLNERYRTLQLAQGQLDMQARQLKIANEITQLIHADLDLDRTLTSVTEALVMRAGFGAARINLGFRSSEATVDRAAHFGEPSEGTTAISHELVARGATLGTLEVWLDPARQSESDGSVLLESVLPSICLALDESLAFHIVNEYRATLEKRVADRTTELQTARDKLADTVSDLRDAQAVRNRIFANINHEIRTPLSLVMLSASELRSRYSSKTDERALASVANIESACERLLSMVDSLLLLAAGQEGKLKVKSRDCDIGAETIRIVHIWQPLAKQHQIDLSYAGPEHLAAYVDTAALERILANLISNAIKYTPDGGTVEVSLTPLDESLVLSVRDTGIGIDDEFRKRIFGRFEQGRPAVRHGARSSGIGLSIVKELVEAHMGSVSVENNRGGGSIFRVTLPLHSTETVDTSSSSVGLQRATIGNLSASFGLNTISQETSRIIAPSDEARATILIAEDDSGLRSSVGELLLGAGYRVLLASDGFTALKMAAEHHPDMLVSDVGMPGMDGYELSRRFRDLRQNRLAPVLLLTAYGTTSDKLSGFQAGAVDYIVKPFEPRELLVRAESQLKVRDLALRLSESEKLASLGTMSAGLAHEMRNPANGLLNALDPLVSLLPPEFTTADSATGQLIDVVRDCAEQLGRLSKQLLGFKREGTLTTADEDVSKLLARAMNMVNATSVEVRMKAEYAGRLRCAGPMILQVLVNLLDNAVQAAGANGTVDVVTRLDNGKVIIDVSDSGAGVPQELREKIFEPFFTTKPPGAGTGLGLSTARQIVDQHQGKLRVVEGTRGTFRIELPLNGPIEVSVGTTRQRDSRTEQAVS